MVRWVQGVALSSLLCAGVSHAGAPSSPPSDPSNSLTFYIAFADDPAVTAAYAVVPNDVPVVLPLTARNNMLSGVVFPEVPILETVALTVDGDPAGAVTAYSPIAPGGAVATLTWTPGAVREIGRASCRERVSLNV